MPNNHASRKKNSYHTKGGIEILCTSVTLPYGQGKDELIKALDSQRGVLLVSNVEYPGRYSRWDIGFINPPLQITARMDTFSIEALNERGQVLLHAIAKAIADLNIVENLSVSETNIKGTIPKTSKRFPEELRSKQPSIFSVLRAVIDLFFNAEDEHLGLYGAFGYDLTFQFEPIKLSLLRSSEQRDMVLFLPDEIFLVDHRKEMTIVNHYDFKVNSYSTEGLPRTGMMDPYIPNTTAKMTSDHQPGEYANLVNIAKQSFKRGDLFEVVPSQKLSEACPASPSTIFCYLQEYNPSPYSFLFNLGKKEYLVGVSPEMYVRVSGKRIESCPISGTIKRGKDAIHDAEQILNLLKSEKDAAELTMCTDVDRNDKSRICKPGSVKIIGRRQIEMYSRLIHTVDHVEGELQDGYDALDGFLTHTWAVTVTGAPKAWAMQFIENHERSPREWYGGAVGFLGFNGDMNTGLTIRTARIMHGIAEVRVGATLLYDSIPEEEENETYLKASALLDAIRRSHQTHMPVNAGVINKAKTKQNKNILLVDHQDSFVHTLANYFRQTGGKVTTLRSGFTQAELKAVSPDLMVLSPGPGCPKDFDVNTTIKMALDAHIPLFGVCLGLQAIVEYFGGELKVLDYPMHGKKVKIETRDSRLFEGLPKILSVGLYHSLYANKEKFPNALRITAESEPGIIMAIEHTTLPIWAVQFHPESILSLDENLGYLMIENVVHLLK